MTNEWDEASDEERAEAEALAQALDGEGSAPSLDVAALLTHAKEGELDPSRLADRLDRVLRPAPASGKVIPLPDRRRRTLGYAASAAVAIAAAALLLFRTGEVRLPVPSAGFVRAQARATSGADDRALDEATANHRRLLYARLGGP